VKVACLTWDPSANKDGVGAQILRQLQTISLSNNLKLNYLYKNLEQFESNYGDGFESKDERDSYINLINNFFLLQRYSCNHNYHIEWVIPALFCAKWRIFRLFISFANLFSRLIRKPVAIVPGDIGFIFNSRPKLYDSLRILNILERTNSNLPLVSRKLKVAVHIRRALISDSQQAIRFQSTSWYLNNLKTIVNALEKKGLRFEIIIHTDAPFIDSSFDLNTLSTESRNYLLKNDALKLNGNIAHVQGENFEKVFSKLDGVRIIRLAKPIDFWSDFLDADIILLGKSTFSFVSALLNKDALVINPTGLLNPPSNWIDICDNEVVNQNVLLSFIDNQMISKE
jgi:hypothetical protein